MSTTPQIGQLGQQQQQQPYGQQQFGPQQGQMGQQQGQSGQQGPSTVPPQLQQQHQQQSGQQNPSPQGQFGQQSPFGQQQGQPGQQQGQQHIPPHLQQQLQQMGQQQPFQNLLQQMGPQQQGQQGQQQSQQHRVPQAEVPQISTQNIVTGVAVNFFDLVQPFPGQAEILYLYVDGSWRVLIDPRDVTHSLVQEAFAYGQTVFGYYDTSNPGLLIGIAITTR
ncbi:hypothetical protein G3I40_00490 [Streptomyces sp. SID14478]|uniref:hypothetical protein n=1 Tax=Streptomyces sp. SID14478 TaxID=2706073 RepID=UPI0013D957BE|nr:hypothetical protein [Streptomyces sp. SID14478]NEB73732.1 hypothetical protein [Streptomyces sp. SID14478]